MTLNELLDRLIELEEAGYSTEEIVLTTETGSMAGEFRLGAVMDNDQVAQIPGASWPEARIVR